MSDLRGDLERLARRERILVATDFDGVLAPLVLDPMQARPTAGTVERLRALATRPGVRVAIVSGRDLASLRTLTGLAEHEPVVLIGSHGGETSVPLPVPTDLTPAHRELLHRAAEVLQPVLDAHPGTYLEPKPAGVVLHTRRADPTVGEQAVAQAQQATASLTGLRAMTGKEILEFTVLDVTKGVALEALAQEADTSATLYLGDDVTDERAFAVLDTADGHVTVKVGPGETLAAHRVAGPDDVPAIFEQVDAIRQES